VTDGSSAEATDEARTYSLHPIKKCPRHESKSDDPLHFVIRTTNGAKI
jgi:hypothetical protein